MFAADGSTSWTTDISSCAPTAVAASPANAVVAACRDGVLLRFDSTGAPLTAWAIPDNANQVHTVSMAFDAQGALFIHATRISSAHQGTRVITRLDATGAALFSITEPVPAVQSSALDYSVARPGLRMTSNGQAFLQLPHHELLSGIVLSTADAGGLIETFTAAGGASWSLDKPFVVTYSPYATFDAAEILDSACDGSGHCALFGAYGDSGWIEELSVP